MTEKQTSDALALGRIRAVIDILQTINNIQTTESIVVRIHDAADSVRSVYLRSAGVGASLLHRGHPGRKGAGNSHH